MSRPFQFIVEGKPISFQIVGKRYRQCCYHPGCENGVTFYSTVFANAQVLLAEGPPLVVVRTCREHRHDVAFDEAMEALQQHYQVNGAPRAIVADHDRLFNIGYMDIDVLIANCQPAEAST